MNVHKEGNWYWFSGVKVFWFATIAEEDAERYLEYFQNAGRQVCIMNSKGGFQVYAEKWLT